MNSVPAGATESRWLVSTEWLAARLHANDLVVVDGSYYVPTTNRDAEAEYRAGHIPGALRFDIEAIADHSTTLPHMLPSADAFADAVGALGEVQAALAGTSIQVVDARPADRFAGAAPEPRPGLRRGHMPGARNVPYTALIEDGTLVSAERIRGALAAGGVDIDKPIITSCGSGVTAATLWLALDSLGKSPQAHYNGASAEWGARRHLPIVPAPAKPNAKP